MGPELKDAAWSGGLWEVPPLSWISTPLVFDSAASALHTGSAIAMPMWLVSTSTGVAAGSRQAST